MTNPYETLPEMAFWSTAVAKRNCFDITDLWRPKFDFRLSTSVATFGSCFAQHFGAALRQRELRWLNTEPAPQGLSAENAKKFGYNVFSCRTGNIYTASLFSQWLDWATDERSPPDEYWESDGRIFDPFRPRIEPAGFDSPDEMVRSRSQAISSFRKALARTDVLVFTLGLTESWHHVDGWEYPMCPGTAAGEYSEDQHRFDNQGYVGIREKLEGSFSRIRLLNPNIKFLLTVSPVPLTATKSGDHVLVATMRSKSVLRTVAGELADLYDDIDYFPSYEIINGTPFQGMFFESNKRNVGKMGVNFVMDTFFMATGLDVLADRKNRRAVKVSSADSVCDEEILGAFGG